MSKNLKKIIIFLGTFLILWLIGAVYLTSQASNIVFNNQVSWAPVPQYQNNYELNFIKNSNNQHISMWTFENQTSQNWILYLHGNAGRLADFFQYLTPNANVLSPAYPGYHESEGKPSVENVYETATLAYDWLVNVKKVPENKITILGHSMGGSPATYLASKKPQAKKLVLINTFSSIQSMFFSTYSILCVFSGNIFNTAKNAEKVTIPVRQYAYKGDLTVPYQEGKTLFTYFTATKDKKFTDLEKFTHSYPDFELIMKDMF